VKPNRLLNEPPSASREIVRIDWGIVHHHLRLFEVPQFLIANSVADDEIGLSHDPLLIELWITAALESYANVPLVCCNEAASSALTTAAPPFVRAVALSTIPRAIALRASK
jgi:hypothetical protein